MIILDTDAENTYISTVTHVLVSFSDFNTLSAGRLVPDRVRGRR